MSRIFQTERNIEVIYICLINLEHYKYKFGEIKMKFVDEFCPGQICKSRTVPGKQERNFQVSLETKYVSFAVLR